MPLTLHRKARRGPDRALGFFDHVGGGWGEDQGVRIEVRFRLPGDGDPGHYVRGDRPETLALVMALVRHVAAVDLMLAAHDDPALRRANYAWSPQRPIYQARAEEAVLAEVQALAVAAGPRPAGSD